MTEDSLMKRLAKMLAEASEPPCARTRLTDALVSGDFDAFIEGDDATTEEPDEATD